MHKPDRSEEENSTSAKRAFRFYRFAALVLFLAGLGGTVLVAQHRVQAVETARATWTTVTVDDMTARLEAGLRSYRQALVAQQALFTSDGDRVTRSEFDGFVTQLQRSPNYPGLYGTAYVQVVTEADRTRFLSDVKSERGRAVTITPRGTRPVYYVLRYQNPTPPGSNSTARDLLTDRNIAPTLEQARDTGAMTLSREMGRAEDPAHPGQQQSFYALFAPIYASGGIPGTLSSRRSTIVGWVSSDIEGADLLATLADADKRMGVAIADSASPAAPVVATLPAGFRPPAASASTRTIDMGGRSWLLTFAPVGRAVPPVWFSQGTTLSIGGLLSLLLAALLWLFGAHAGQRGRLAAELSRNERVFRSAFENAMVGMSLTGTDGRLMRVNEVFASMLGRTQDELVGIHFSEITHPDDPSDSPEKVRRALAGEISGFRTERRYRHRDSSAVYCDLSTSLVRDVEGNPLYFTTQTVDMTKRWAAQRERDTRTLMLDSVIANSQSLVYVKDLDGRYLLANQPFERAFQVTEAELLGRDDTYLDPELAAVWRINDLRAQREEYHVDEWSDSPNGRYYYESVKFPLFDADGRVYATCGISLDVTASRRAAAEMEAARDAALAATRAKSSFLATMSHEIRTPMNAVIGMSGLLLDTQLDDQQREFVETVRTSGDALLATINNILDFSKLEAREVELEDAPFDLQECLEEAVSLVAVAAGRVDLVVHVDPRCPRFVRGDLHRLRQVLVNLVGNAVKFTEQGDILVSVCPAEAYASGGAATEEQPFPVEGPGADADRELMDAGREPADTERDLRDQSGAPAVACTFTVRDTGIGIPADRLDRLFKSFSQVDASTTRVYGGSGLGLAISRAIVAAMGGTITVSSKVGVGSSFTFDLLLRAAEDQREPLPSAEVSNLFARRALLVDDNDTNRRILRLQLESWGMRCIDAASGKDALAILATDARFDVAVLDLDMPAMDGDQLAARIRAMSSSARLPLILLTSMATAPAATSLFDALHTKPVRIGVLKKVLAELLRAAPSSRQTPHSPAVRELTGQRSLLVLLAEDNPVNQIVGKAMLARLGHRVETAKNGQEALDKAIAGHFDVVLMDVHMPELDGIDATRAIRTHVPAAKQPRIIALTASALEEDRRSCDTAGMNAYLLKPVRLEQLAAALNG